MAAACVASVQEDRGGDVFQQTKILKYSETVLAESYNLPSSCMAEVGLYASHPDWRYRAFTACTSSNKNQHRSRLSTTSFQNVRPSAYPC